MLFWLRKISSVGAVYDRPFWLNHGKCAVTDRAYSGTESSVTCRYFDSEHFYGSEQQQQERIIQRVRPRGHTEPAEHKEAAECKAAQHAKSERLQVERIAKRADVVKCRKDDGAGNDREHTRRTCAEAEQRACARRKTRHQQNTEE